MALNRTIQEVVNALKPSQRKLLRAKLRKQLRGLFDIYASQKKIEDPIAMGMLGLDGPAFFAAKSRLLPEVAAILGRMAEEQQATHLLRRKLQEARGYLLVGCEAEALDCYQRALSLAHTHHMHETCIEIEQSIAAHFGQTVEQARNHSLTDLIEQVRIEYEDLGRLQEAIQIKQLLGQAKTETALRLLKGIPTNNADISPKSALFRGRTSVIAHVVLRDFDKAEQACRAIQGLLAHHPSLALEPVSLESLVASVLVLAGILSQRGQSSEALKALLRFKDLLTSVGAAPPVGIDYQIRWLEIEEAGESRNLERLSKLVRQSETLSLDNATTDDKRLAQLQFIAARTCIVSGLNKDGLRIARWLAGRRVTDRNASLLAIASLLELVALVQLFITDEIPACLRRLLRRLKQAGVSPEVSTALRHALAIPMHEPQDKKKVWASIVTELEGLRSKPENMLIFEAFDLVEWAKEKI